MVDTLRRPTAREMLPPPSPGAEPLNEPLIAPPPPAWGSPPRLWKEGLGLMGTTTGERSPRGGPSPVPVPDPAPVPAAAAACAALISILLCELHTVFSVSVATQRRRM